MLILLLLLIDANFVKSEEETTPFEYIVKELLTWLTHSASEAVDDTDRFDTNDTVEKS